MDWDIIKPGINTIILEGKKYLIVKVDKWTRTVWFKKKPETAA